MQNISPILRGGKRHLVTRALPKLDMHVHISLAWGEQEFLRHVKAHRKAGLPSNPQLTPNFLMERDSRYYPVLTDFHNTYESMRGLTRTADDLAQVTYLYLKTIAERGAIYAEVSNSFRDEENFDAQIDAISRGIKAARINTGIRARIVTTVLRNAGPDHAQRAVNHLIGRRRKFIGENFVTGFGIAGDEDLGISAVRPFTEYMRVFHDAWHEAGLGLTPHVAEQFFQNSVDFVDSIPTEAFKRDSRDHRRLRVGHGTLIHISTDMMKFFADHGICLEVCMSSNKRINLPQQTQNQQLNQVFHGVNRDYTADLPVRQYYNNIANHPLKLFLEHNIPVCLGSDNPLLMNTDISKDHSLTVKAGMEEMETMQFTDHGIDNSNTEQEEREELRRISRTAIRKVQSGDRTQTPLGYVLV